MKIIAYMKNGTIKTWHWKSSWALICIRYIKELQEDLNTGAVKYVTLISDNGNIYMRKGLKLLTWNISQCLDAPEEYIKL